tara:strand:+ start:134 stop:367 length:234 start_codon:yes stop_codon:yes gene_type:complete
MFDNRKWVIVNVSDITDEMLDNSIEGDIDNLRKSLDNSQALLKWEGNTPSCFSSMTIYNHDEICVELLKDTWSQTIE